MADPAAAVTDTHPLIFHAAGSGRLGRHAARLFERITADDQYVEFLTLPAYELID